VKQLVDLLRRAGRWKVQLATALVLNAYFLNVYFAWLKRVPCTGFNCHACPAATFACPVGATQSAVIDRQVPLYLLGVLGMVGLFLGRLSCGWFCPFGFLQEQLYRLKSPKLEISHGLTWMPYLFLIVLVGVVPYFTYELWFCKLCPVGTLEAGIPWVIDDSDIRSQVGWFFFFTLAILLVFLVAMVMIKRPFCRLVCPLGAIYSPFNRHSVLQLEVDHGQCIKCGQCREVCPVDIDISDDANSAECVRCFECAKICPVDAIVYWQGESKVEARVDG
jgi:polyferredoxin